MLRYASFILRRWSELDVRCCGENGEVVDGLSNMVNFSAINRPQRENLYDVTVLECEQQRLDGN